MPARPRLYLFHGSDSHASLRALQNWVRLFSQKHGDATRYFFDADELTLDQLQREVAGVLEGATLFPVPKLLVIRRLSQLDRSAVAKSSQALVDLLQERLRFIDQEVTILMWEERLLSANHPTVRRFTEWEKAGLAEIRAFRLPSGSVLRLALSYAKEQGYALTREAAQWLQEQYQLLEQEARLEQRLRSGDELGRDLRGWWLHGLLDSAMLRATGEVITLQDLTVGTQEVAILPQAFRFAQAVGDGKWQQARQLLRQLEQHSTDEGVFFSWYAALRWQVTGRPGRIGPGQVQHLLELLAEIELVSKNFQIPHAWLVDVLLLRLEAGSQGGENRTLFDPKRLWLAQLPRS